MKTNYFVLVVTKWTLVINEKKGKIYLSIHPKSPHGDECEYALESASKIELKEYYEKIDADLAKQLLNRILEKRPLEKSSQETPILYKIGTKFLM